MPSAIYLVDSLCKHTIKVNMYVASVIDIWSDKSANNIAQYPQIEEYVCEDL